MAGKAYTLTVRDGPKVSRERFPTLTEAIQALEHATSGQVGRKLRDTVDLRYREFAPLAQVAIRAEVSGPGGLLATRGGIDVRGDGSTEAYTGRVRRRLVEPQSDETVYEALGRALAR
ncbi:MAG: hypothetical protein M3Z33_08030 [Actinomycetota bacterium]|nr:hypothetical protein [Actinomycetota bacterium]